jgi:hypothetical protein
MENHPSQNRKRNSCHICVKKARFFYFSKLYFSPQSIEAINPIYSLVVSRNLSLILLSKNFIVSKFSQTSKNSKDSKSVLIFSLALVLVEFFLAVL